MLAVADPQTTRAWLTRPLDTFRMTYQPGESFEALPVGIDGVWDLFDRQGVLRVSHCPEEAITFDQVNHGEERDRAEFSSREPQDGDNGRGANPNHFRPESESDRRSLSRVPQRGGEGSGAAKCPFDPNVELQLTREPRHVEPRHAQGIARRTLTRAELPQRPGGYVAPLIEGRRAPPPGAVLSAEHPRRGDWGPEWSIALYGIPSGGRTIFCARLNDNEWRQFVDLDRGEWRNWNGPWTPLVGSHVCEFGEYPDPQPGWTRDQLTGLRTVRDRDGSIIGRLGPDQASDLPRFHEWLRRVQQFAASAH